MYSKTKVHTLTILLIKRKESGFLREFVFLITSQAEML